MIKPELLKHISDETFKVLLENYKAWHATNYKFLCVNLNNSICFTNEVSADGSRYFTEVHLDKLLKPKLKPVDMEVFVKSGIDCIFTDESESHNHIEHLISINFDREYVSAQDLEWDRCRPRMHYWFSCINFKNPITLVQELTDAGFDIETRFTKEGGLQHFKITELLDGYCRPWEV